ncbi:alpha/beta fold hydrolase [Acinetobacter baumannii]|nr:alpha/beta hydrolase [Acinetobacter baumannii]HCW3899449.1 alpha/beta hydrolase [Acinetobacter baumannii]HCW4977580.1 alpha/beta hydrolase [Acinetobacter baumannii]HCW5103244.1 alpha/beta hydrolase [Acinetobacter baumannii]HCW5563901.1 alpha/beta hydrolase [Acinetobacter baumannii]
MNKTLAILSTAILLATATVTEAKQTNISPATHTTAASKLSTVPYEMVKYGDVSIQAYVQGKGPTIVIMSSLGRSVRDYDVVAQDLVKQGFRVIRPEVREAIDNAGNEELPEAKRIEYLKRAFFAPMNDPRVWLTGWHHEAHDAQGYARNNTPVDDYFAAGKAPILDIQPEYDTVAPKPLRGVLKGALGDRVTIVEIKNAGHALVPEQPKALADAIGKFAKQQFAKKS